jgi:hypothetical protein
VATGDDDSMIQRWYSHLLHGLPPQSEVRLYPVPAHGFLFQYFAEFSTDVLEFLRTDSPVVTPGSGPPHAEICASRTAVYRGQHEFGAIMGDILEFALDDDGGLDAWNENRRISAHLSQGGATRLLRRSHPLIGGGKV